jgi:hypothetical protein
VADGVYGHKSLVGACRSRYGPFAIKIAIGIGEPFYFTPDGIACEEKRCETDPPGKGL